ncbi:MAG: DUF354 domain-containing protein [Solirubrobacterales bacterium]
MKVWFDCTAAPHPVVLRPLIERFSERGDDVLVTAREYGQTVGLLEMMGIEHQVVGSHGGASLPGRLQSSFGRSAGLVGPVRGFRPDIAIGHGSVELASISAILRIPSIQMQDYEFAGLQRQVAFRAARRVIVPETIPAERMEKVGVGPGKLFTYPGLKEDYYLADFEFDPSVFEDLGVDRSGIVVVFRPPSETSSYYEESPLQERVLDRLAGEAGVTTVVIPRDEQQARAIASRGEPGIVIPDRPVDGQSLIAGSDVVISAGGTMNREAVALGVPVYSTFAGRMGGVDEELVRSGRLRVLGDPSEIELVKRGGEVGPRDRRDPDLLVRAILEVAGQE